MLLCGMLVLLCLIWDSLSKKKKKHLFSLSLLFLISISKDYVVIMLVE